MGWQFVSWHYEKYLLPSLHSEIRIAKERNVDLKREYTAVKQAFEKQKTHFSNTTSSENQNLVKIQQLSLELDSCKTQSANLQNKLERVGNQTHCKSPTPKTKKDLPVNDNVTTSPPSVSKEEKFNRLLSKYDPIEFNDGLNLYNVVTRKAPAPGTVYFVNFDGENPNKRRKSYGSRHYHWSSIIDDIIVHSGVGKRGQQSVVKIEVKSYKKKTLLAKKGMAYKRHLNRTPEALHWLFTPCMMLTIMSCNDPTNTCIFSVTCTR